jgi:hypothetical protein
MTDFITILRNFGPIEIFNLLLIAVILCGAYLPVLFWPKEKGHG